MLSRRKRRYINLNCSKAISNPILHELKIMLLLFDVRLKLFNMTGDGYDLLKDVPHIGHALDLRGHFAQRSSKVPGLRRQPH